MKKFLLIFVLLIGTVSYNTIEAQVSVNLSINIGRQPAWGPVGYDYVDYYYFPDINCYFNVNLGLFYYFDRGRWFSAQYLPYAYRNYDLYGMYKVVLVGVTNPWRYNVSHIRDYGQYKGYRPQLVIRDSRDARYQNSRNNKVAWYSGNQYNNNRTFISGNNRSNSTRAANVNTNNRNSYGNNSSRDNKGIDNRSYASNSNSNTNKNNERNNFNNASMRQQNNNESKPLQRNADNQLQRSSGNQLVSTRSSSDKNSSMGTKRSTSSNRSQGNNRTASNSERSSKSR